MSIINDTLDETQEEKGKFKLLKTTSLSDIIDSKIEELPESDLTIQTNTHLVQFEYVEQEDTVKKFVIKPGCFNIQDTSLGTELISFQLRDYDLLKSINNTHQILSESDRFFSKLDVYKSLNRDPKRAFLLCSPPGVGKTAAINEVCKILLKQDKGTCIVVWDTSALKSRSVNSFFMNYSKFSINTKRLIFIIEDISGGTVEDEYGTKGADTSLLNLLDGVGNPFKSIPTLIIATTNNPEREVGALIDRPGRFDKVLELNTPTEQECISLLEFIAPNELNEEDEEAARIASKNSFSIAHLQEMVVRSLLDDISILEACKQLVKHKERFKSAFQEEKTIGMGIR